MDTLNDWNFVTTNKKEGFREEQLNIVLRDLLQEKEMKIMGEVNVGQMGAVLVHKKQLNAPKQVLIVEWTTRAYTLQEPTIVEGHGTVPQPVGTLVAKAVTWTPVFGIGKCKPEGGRF